MPNAVKCPRCESLVDVTSFAPGSSVRCSDCGGMMRVPTGRTGINPAVKAPVAGSKGTSTRTRVAAASSGGGGTKAKTRVVGAAEMREGTRMRQAAVGRAAAPRPKPKTGLYVLLGVLALALIIGGAVLFLGTPKNAPPSEAPPAAKAPPKLPVPPKPAPAPAPAPAAPPVDVAPPPPPRGGDDASKFNWEEALKQLRGGGGFDVEGRPEQVYFDRVKKLGKAAYPHLIRYIDNEDPALGRAAVAVLNALTNQNKPLPNEGTKTKLKGEWEAWVKANP